MRQRRVTLTLDEDIVGALEAGGSPSLSAAANSALRTSVEADAHRLALASG